LITAETQLEIRIGEEIERREALNLNWADVGWIMDGESEEKERDLFCET